MNSTILGSIKSNLTCLGVLVIINDERIVLIATDLPEPVEPATSKCGAFVRSNSNGAPNTSCPRTIGNSPDFVEASNASLKVTNFFCVLGTSIPTSDLPGIGACILMSLASNVSLILSSIEVIFETFVPGSTSISYVVTVGPILYPTTSAPILKLLNSSLICSLLASASSVCELISTVDCLSDRISDVGSLKPAHQFLGLSFVPRSSSFS